jgi:hypothetical protein
MLIPLLTDVIDSVNFTSRDGRWAYNARSGVSLPLSYTVDGIKVRRLTIGLLIGAFGAKDQSP